MYRILAVLVAVLLLPWIAGNGGGVARGQTAILPTTEPYQVDYSLLRLPSWALPTSASLEDDAVLSHLVGIGTCTPDTSGLIPDMLLLAHRDWCTLGMIGGVYQSFVLDHTSSSQYFGVWAATAFPATDDARSVVSQVDSWLKFQGYAEGICDLGQACTAGLLGAQETFTNPDGTQSPGGSYIVDYRIWTEGNVLGEFAVIAGASRPLTTVQSYMSAVLPNGDSVLQQALSGHQAVPPSATPTATPTARPTMPRLQILSVRAQRSDAQDLALKRAPLQHARVGQRIALATYAEVSRAPAGSRISFTWTIALHGHVLAHHGSHRLVSGRLPARFGALWDHAFTQSGAYVVTGTVAMSGVRQSRVATITITR